VLGLDDMPSLPVLGRNRVVSLAAVDYLGTP
jgi:hypothetical protein